MKNRDIILICRDSASSKIVYNHLIKIFNVKLVIIESAPSKWSLVKRRSIKLGWPKVLNQLLFQIIIVRILKIISRDRIKKILFESGMSLLSIPIEKVVRVNSINEQDSIDLIKSAQASLAVVNGTRIISRNVLDETKLMYINMHAGITPAYRGVHGAYWAYSNGEDKLAGVTIHYIDKGIDTGEVIAQEIIHKDRMDNFVTYPYLQISVGLKILVNTITSILLGNQPRSISLSKKSGLYSHPTFTGYMCKFLFKGVK